jgi:hypothetical protein
MKTRHNTNGRVKPERPPDDLAVEWVTAVNDKAVKAMVAWLKGSLHLSRPISSLTRHEMSALAQTAIHVFIIEASHRVTVEPDPVRREKMKILLS